MASLPDQLAGRQSCIRVCWNNAARLRDVESGRQKPSVQKSGLWDANLTHLFVVDVFIESGSLPVKGTPLSRSILTGKV